MDVVLFCNRKREILISFLMHIFENGYYIHKYDSNNRNDKLLEKSLVNHLIAYQLNTISVN